MICQACDKNETTRTVICDGCMAHYASIREGQYHEQELPVGESNLVIISWRSVAAPAEKKARREEKVATQKRGLFGFGKGNASPAVEPEPPPPPPDWKNRVFPSADPTPEAEPETVESLDAAAAGDAYVMGLETDFSYDLGMPATGENQPSLIIIPEDEPAPLVLDLSPTPSVEAPAPLLESLLTDVAVEEELAPAPEVTAFEPAPPFTPVAPEPEPEQAAELTSFFESLAAPPAAAEAIAPAPVEAPPVDEVPPAPTNASLASFFESLTAPAAPVPAVEPVAPAAPINADLTSFFDSLATPPAPAVEPAVDTPATPAAAELASFFESLSAAPVAPVTPPEPAPAPESAPEPEIAAAPVFEPEHEAFATPVFESEQETFDAPAFEPEPVVAPVFEAPVVPTPEPEAPSTQEAANVDVPAADAELADFFNALSVAAPTLDDAEGAEDASPFDFDLNPSAGLPETPFDFLAAPEIPNAPIAAESTPEARPAFELTSQHFAAPPEPAPVELVVSPPAPEAPFEAPAANPDGRQPFSIDIQMPGATPGSGAASGPRQSEGDRPPTHGKPFSIDLTPPTPADPATPRSRTQTDAFKQQNGTGELAFVGAEDDDDDDDQGGFGLLDGLSFDAGAAAGQEQPPSNASFRASRDDDEDDDSRTIDL